MCIATILLCGSLSMAAPAEAPARLRVTHRDLVVSSLDGRPMAGRSASPARGEHVLVITASAARGGEAAGTARVRFVAEPGHRYEVEVRAGTTAYGPGAWRPGEWTPVVRDRGVSGRDDGPAKLVGSAPEWLSAGER